MTIQKTFEQLELAAPVVAGNLAVVPLVGKSPDNTTDYVLLDEALEDGSVEITELSEGGSVPELKLTNKGKRPVLLLDGDQLIGAKQNRVINITILVDAETAVVIPVSCVEQGRWSYRSRHFRSSGRTVHASLRRSKAAQVSESMRRTGTRCADQGAMWDDIATMSSRHAVYSDTGAAEDLYSVLDERLHQLKSKIRLPGQSRGAVFCIDGKPVGIELFDRPDTLRKVERRLIGSFAFDAASSDKPVEALPATESVEAFFYRVMKTPAQRFKAVGLGEDLRLESLHVVGGALAVGQGLVHLSAFEREREFV